MLEERLRDTILPLLFGVMAESVAAAFTHTAQKVVVHVRYVESYW